MALILNLYKDAQCKTPVLSPVIGVAGITGYYAEKTNWVSDSMWGYRFYRAQLSNNAGRQGVILSGAVPIFNFQSIADREIFTTPDTNAITTDAARNNQTTKVYNIVFAGIRTQSGNRLTSNTINFIGNQTPNWFNCGIRLQQYVQEPLDATGVDRTLWAYNNSGSYFESSAQLTGELQQCVCVYKFPMWDDEFYLFALGVSAGGAPNANTELLAVPVDFFKDKEIKPYIGPVSKESAESAYITGSRPKNNVEPRTLTNKNMFGFNADGVFLTKISESQYRTISSEIYNGLSGNALNALGQVVSTVVGGNSRRPAEEIRTIIDGVFCCHAVPNANRFPTTGTVQLSTICGYDMFSREFPLQTIDRWEQWEISSGIIPRPSGSFLDFSPYTTATLSIPILGNIDIDPSALLGNALSLWFTLDAFTGSLSCDISIVENGTKWIYSTLQGNCAVELPMIGAGQNANPLLKIAGGVSSIFTGGAQNIPNAIINVYDGIQQAAYTRPISRVQSSNILPIVAPTDIYLTITTPNNVNAGDYWRLAGIPSHMSGNVGDFRGFTVFEHVDLSGVSGATESELSEIESSLKGGVWL